MLSYLPGRQPAGRLRDGFDPKGSQGSGAKAGTKLPRFSQQSSGSPGPSGLRRASPRARGTASVRWGTLQLRKSSRKTLPSSQKSQGEGNTTGPGKGAGRGKALSLGTLRSPPLPRPGSRSQVSPERGCREHILPPEPNKKCEK